MQVGNQSRLMIAVVLAGAWLAVAPARADDEPTDDSLIETDEDDGQPYELLPEDDASSAAPGGRGEGGGGGTAVQTPAPPASAPSERAAAREGAAGPATPAAAGAQPAATENPPAGRKSAPVVRMPPWAAANPDAPYSIAEVAERVVRGVVNISTTRVSRPEESPLGPFSSDQFWRFFDLPQPKQRVERSLGSGVIVSQDGLVLTNSHVVEKASDIRITLSDREEYRAKVVGTDPQTDLALLRLEGHPKDLHPLKLGSSARMRLGDVVLAVGDPFGVGQTVTMGIISAKGRASMGIAEYEDFIQTDAAINPGNSGGALVNLAGEVIGINTAILSRSGGYQGVGFAIPSDMARPVMEMLLAHGRVVRGHLGVGIQDLTPALAKAMKLKVTTGALISEVTPSGPAARAGIQRGDVILRVGNTPIDSAAHLRNLIAMRAPGSKVSLQLLRGGKDVTVEVKLGAQPSAKASGEGTREEQGVLSGLSLHDLDARTRQRYQVDAEVKQGVVVTEVAPQSAAASSGLQAGDVILEVNRKPVDSVKTFHQIYSREKGRALLLVYRDGMTLFLLLSR